MAGTYDMKPPTGNAILGAIVIIVVFCIGAILWAQRGGQEVGLILMISAPTLTALVAMLRTTATARELHETKQLVEQVKETVNGKEDSA